MRRKHPQPTVRLPISFESYQQLTRASASMGYQLEHWEIATLAIQEYLARGRAESIATPATSGVQWKQLFLPSGTVLRTVFNGKNYHCRVEGDELKYEGMRVSPSGFANAMGGMRRNAWKVIWILFPQSQTWQLAASLRPMRPPNRQQSQLQVRNGTFARH